MASLELNNVRKSWDNSEVIHGINLSIQDGEFVVFVGPSGCGKSTLLRLISGLETLSSGSIRIGGRDVSATPASQRGIAMVFQSYALYPNMSVWSNLAYPLQMAKQPKADVQRQVDAVANVLHLAPLLERYPKALSGGQRQRVAIGRAIIRQPEIFLFDEPLSNLDAELRLQMRIEITKLHNQLNATMVYVTHDQLEAMTLADRIVVLRDGVIEQVGAPLTLYHDPDNLFVAGFIGSPKMNLLPATVVNVCDNRIQIRVDALGLNSLIAEVHETVQEGESITLGIRPEHVLDDTGSLSAERCFTAPVSFAEHLGHTNYLYLDIGGENMFVVESRTREQVRPNVPVTFGFDLARTLLFRDNGLRIR